MPEDRRHAASCLPAIVMARASADRFTDIIGYTALMGSDEDQAFEMPARNHTIHETFIIKHNNTLIKEIGDGTLASFPLAFNAVRCAMDIQKEAKSLKIPLKIGIHEGEKVFGGADVLGDGVNVISRLEELANNGSLHPVLQAFIDEEDLQCGYCTPGMILTAFALLHKNPTPSEEAIMEEMDGNLCRCDSYKRIVHSIKSAANVLKEDH